MKEQYDDLITNPVSDNKDSFARLCEKRYSRRCFIKSSLVTSVGLTTFACSKETVESEAIVSESTVTSKFNFDFIEIEHGNDQDHHVAPDHTASILLRWGDPIFADAPEFDINNQSAERQSRQFGYNNDFIGFISLCEDDRPQDRALLCINHEYTLAGLMFPDFGRNVAESTTAKYADICKAALGVSIVEIQLQDNQWGVNRASAYNRRITALDSVIKLSGPAAGHTRMQTSGDPAGLSVIGTFNNCSGGITPWGTYLTCEENFNFHFSGSLDDLKNETDNHRRYNLGHDLFFWSKFDKRFDFNREPNEPNRFGWVVEIDPMDPTSTPIKRTALGRFKHEGAKNVIAKDGRLVIYMGDDQRFEYLYKFVSRDEVNLTDKKANQDLLDFGTLYVAKFDESSRLEWMALDISNPLLKDHFDSQADILIQARSAADLLDATPMDRPEDAVPNPQTGKVYVMLTNNTKRKDVNGVNPREDNSFGHIIEITEDEDNFSSQSATWDLLVKCGDPSDQEHDADWNPNTSENGWFACPDNGVIDPAGRLWVSTDQGAKTSLSGTSDGLWALETQGELRGTGNLVDCWVIF